MTDSGNLSLIDSHVHQAHFSQCGADEQVLGFKRPTRTSNVQGLQSSPGIDKKMI